MFDNTNKSKISKECFHVVLCLLLGAVLLPQFIDLVLLQEEVKVSETYSLFFRLTLIQVLITIPIALLIYPKHRSIENILFAVGLPQLIAIYIFGGSLLTSLVCTIALVGLYLAIYLFPVLWEQIRKKDPFEKLSFEERLIVLRKIVRIEKKHLGINLELELVPKSMLAETLASYCPRNNLIEINKFNLTKDRPCAIDLVQTVCHECMHAAQFQAILQANSTMLAAMNTEDRILIKKIRHNFIYYKEASKNGKAYKNQLIERQARGYAQKQKTFYRRKIRAIIKSCLNQSPEPPKSKVKAPGKIQNSRIA